MEEMILDDFSDIKIAPVEFMATFDHHTGAVIAVGPSIAFENEQYKLPIDAEIAISIIEGKTPLTSCVVNIAENQVEISETKTLFKIDDVLHRITESKFADFDIVDVCVTQNSNEFVFELSKELGGTRENPAQQSKKQRKLVWGGETTLYFFVTDYNDPNVLHQNIQFSLDDLNGKSVTVKKVDDLPTDFSVYTRRLFKNYMIEAK